MSQTKPDRQTNLVNALGVVALALAILGGCKKAAEVSTAQSIGSATGMVSERQRSRQYCGPGGRSAQGNVDAMVDSNWRALPPRIAAEFSGGKYRPILAADAAEQCGPIVARSDVPSAVPNVCFRYEKDESGRPFPRLVLPRDTAAINHSLIMQATKAYVDFYLDGLFGPAADDAALSGRQMNKSERQLARFVTDFRRAREALAAAFVDDLKAANMQTALSKMSSGFRTSEDVLVEQIGFQNYVLTHIVDSYYCNADTARELNMNFLVRTRGAFMGFVDFFGAPWFAATTAEN